MGRIADKFAELRAKGEKALILYVTAGDPELAELPGILEALAEGGADLIEIGIPFSDPIADGPTIQAATQRALDRGITPAQAYEAVAQSTAGLPLIAMGYYNSILRPGIANAAATLRESGFSGSIISDLTPEEAGGWKNSCDREGLDTIFLAAPTSTDERLDTVCRLASGFVYAVSRTGVTGAGTSVPPEAGDLIRRIKARTELPVCVGFGISEPAHVRTLSEVADGVVIGSWLVDLLSREWNGGAGTAGIVAKIRALKEATKS